MSENDEKLISEIRDLEGPILILGASGFVGANLFQMVNAVRLDVHGTASRLPAWRLESIPVDRVHIADLLVQSNLDQLLNSVKPRTVFDCIAYGAYSFETDGELIHQMNFNFTRYLIERLQQREIWRYIHAGSSSEYGDHCSAPAEDQGLQPNSHYSVSKAAASHLIYYYGQHLKFPCANLRLYSVYGPMEDSSRLISNLVRMGIQQELPEFVDPSISRDFVYIDDVCRAFIKAANSLSLNNYGWSFNIGTGIKTTISDLAREAQSVFGVTCEPKFTMPTRQWDLPEWYARPDRANEHLNWVANVSLREGLLRTFSWMKSLPSLDAYQQSSKRNALDLKRSVSAIIACYKDDQAIPIMYARLTKTFQLLKIDYEIIFVNDCSPDKSEETIRQLSRDDYRVIGISHSRNFGSQAAFVSGMRLSTKNSCVLLDGDLQDPPELIQEFIAQWRLGYDVVYGRRVKREATLFMQFAYKAFYRIFDFFSYIKVPHDAGDFSLIDRTVVQAILQFPERDLFLRGVRAYVGFQQVGVDYHRPERMFGQSTNNLMKNIGWAKKGILSFSNTPLNMLTALAGGLLGTTILLSALQVGVKILYPQSAPKGATTIILMIMLFGSLTISCLAILGEYVAKIFEEVKQRPLYVRRAVIKSGKIRTAEFHATERDEN